MGTATDLSSILAAKDVAVRVPARCQREVLKRVADQAARSFGLRAEPLLADLMAREQLGSTGIGRGVAIPHAKADLPGVRGVCFTLQAPIEFEAVDDVPVDVVFLLLAPVGDDAGHLKALSKVARRLRGEAVQRALRAAATPDTAFAALTRPEALAA